MPHLRDLPACVRVAMVCGLLLAASCVAPLHRRLPERAMLKVVADNHNRAGGDLVGARGEFEAPLVENISYHFAWTYLESQDFAFEAENGADWDEVNELTAGLRNWFQAGPFLLGVGAEIGYGYHGHGDDDDDHHHHDHDHDDESDRWVLAFLGSARWDIGEPSWGVSVEAEGQYRVPFNSDRSYLPGGADPDDVLSGWIFFLGVGVYF